MRKACRIAADVLDRLCAIVAPGMSTLEIDNRAKELISEYGATSASYNYKSGRLRYPSYICISVNEEIVHGIGRADKILKMGDVVSLDVCVIYDGWVGDNARTVCVGPVSAEVERLLRVTREAMHMGIDQARVGNRVGDISNCIQRHVEANNFGIVREFVGHGVGRGLHEEPQVPNYGARGRGPRLAPGMTICIEPMVTLGSPSLKMGPDGWVALARDGKPAAHFEHTILITDGDPEILTRPSSEAVANK